MTHAAAAAAAGRPVGDHVQRHRVVEVQLAVVAEVRRRRGSPAPARPAARSVPLERAQAGAGGPRRRAVLPAAAAWRTTPTGPRSLSGGMAGRPAAGGCTSGCTALRGALPHREPRGRQHPEALCSARCLNLGLGRGGGASWSRRAFRSPCRQSPPPPMARRRLADMRVCGQAGNPRGRAPNLGTTGPARPSPSLIIQLGKCFPRPIIRAGASREPVSPSHGAPVATRTTTGSHNPHLDGWLWLRAGQRGRAAGRGRLPVTLESLYVLRRSGGDDRPARRVRLLDKTAETAVPEKNYKKNENTPAN